MVNIWGSGLLDFYFKLAHLRSSIVLGHSWLISAVMALMYLILRVSSTSNMTSIYITFSGFSAGFCINKREGYLLPN